MPTARSFGFSILYHLAIVAIGFFGRGFYDDWQRDEPKIKIEVDTVYVYHTLVDTVETERIRYIVKWKESAPLDQDSLWESAKDYWYDILGDSLNYYRGFFTAQVDTVYKDSILTANISFISPMILHPNSRFIMSFNVRETIIDSTFYIDDTFYNKFSLSAGIRNKILNQVLSASFFGEFSYNTINTKSFRLPIIIRGVYNDRLTGEIDIKAEFKF